MESRGEAHQFKGWFTKPIYPLGIGRMRPAHHGVALMTAGIRLAIATPCFGGHVSTLYAASIFKLQRALRGIPEIELAIQLRDGTP